MSPTGTRPAWAAFSARIRGFCRLQWEALSSPNDGLPIPTGQRSMFTALPAHGLTRGFDPVVNHLAEIETERRVAFFHERLSNFTSTGNG